MTPKFSAIKEKWFVYYLLLVYLLLIKQKQNKTVGKSSTCANCIISTRGNTLLLTQICDIRRFSGNEKSRVLFLSLFVYVVDQ